MRVGRHPGDTGGVGYSPYRRFRLPVDYVLVSCLLWPSTSSCGRPSVSSEGVLVHVDVVAGDGGDVEADVDAGRSAVLGQPGRGEPAQALLLGGTDSERWDAEGIDLRAFTSQTTSGGPFARSGRSRRARSASCGPRPRSPAARTTGRRAPHRAARKQCVPRPRRYPLRSMCRGVRVALEAIRPNERTIRSCASRGSWRPCRCGRGGSTAWPGGRRRA